MPSILLPLPAEVAQIPKFPPPKDAKVVADQENQAGDHCQTRHNDVNDAQEQVPAADPGVCGQIDCLQRSTASEVSINSVHMFSTLRSESGNNTFCPPQP